MKKMKIFLIFTFAFALIAFFGIATIKVNAQETQETQETQEEIKDEEDTETTETTEEVDKVKQEVNEWINNFFSPDKVAMYLSWLAYIATIIGLVTNIKKLKQANNLTLKNVSEEVKQLLNDNITNSVNVGLDKYLPKIAEGQEKTNAIMEIFAKILALSQENTPESRVAILNLIQELGTVGQELVNTAKEIVEEGQKAIEEHKAQVEEKLDEIIEKYDGTSI